MSSKQLYTKKLQAKEGAKIKLCISVPDPELDLDPKLVISDPDK